eukprot:1158904-Pelagomonas_calceolata.AAC.9
MDHAWCFCSPLKHPPELAGGAAHISKLKPRSVVTAFCHPPSHTCPGLHTCCFCAPHTVKGPGLARGAAPLVS